MDAETFWCLRQFFMLTALSAAVLFSSFCLASPVSPSLRIQGFDESIPFLRNEPDGVRGQQLVIAKGSRDGLSVKRWLFYSRLRAIFAVAARLECVNSNDLFLGEAGSRGDFGVSAFVLDVTLRLLRNKIEILAIRATDPWRSTAAKPESTSAAAAKISCCCRSFPSGEGRTRDGLYSPKRAIIAAG
jgi:hypothetical protein